MTKKITPIQTKKYRAFLKSLGWEFARINGDHEIWLKDTDTREIVFITNDKDVSPFIIRQNNETLGITKEEFLSLIRKKNKKQKEAIAEIYENKHNEEKEEE